MTLDQRDPVGVIIWSDVTRDQEEDVHHPPDAQAPESQELPHSSPGEAETEPGRQWW